MDQVEKQKEPIRILAYNLPLLEEKIAKLNKRAKRLGLTPVEVKVGTYIPARKDTEGRSIPARYEIEVIGQFPKIPGWTFMGVVEHTEHGNILRNAPDQTIPETYRNAPRQCDHCGKVRNRKDTYIVKHDETQGVKQVGHNCIKDYLGGKSPEMIAWSLSFEKELRELGEEGAGGWASSEIEINEFVAFVCAQISLKGYFISRAKVNEAAEQGNHSLSTTSSDAMSSIFQSRSNKAEERAMAVLPSNEDIELAHTVIAWARAKLNQPGLNDYERNLSIISQKTVLASRDMGLIASMVPAYQKAMNLIEERKTERQARPVSEHFGVVGKRETWELTCKKALSFDTDFGTMFIYIFEDKNGNTATWKTNKEYPVDGQHGTKEMEQGKTYLVKATVKEHGIYKEKKQTVLTRAAVTEIAVPVDAAV